MVNEMCPKCDARNVTLLEFRYLAGSMAPVKMWTCLNRFCMHRWPNLVSLPPSRALRLFPVDPAMERI
jgi:hypothetical protein